MPFEKSDGISMNKIMVRMINRRGPGYSVLMILKPELLTLILLHRPWCVPEEFFEFPGEVGWVREAAFVGYLVDL